MTKPITRGTSSGEPRRLLEHIRSIPVKVLSAWPNVAKDRSQRFARATPAFRGSRRADFRASVACVLGVAAAIACISCNPTGPSRVDLSGTWTGTSSYPNAPFQLRLTQIGDSLRGSYADRLDSSLSVTGTVAGGVMAVRVDFGDAQLGLDGTLENPRRMRGTMRTSALGNTPHPFTMTR